jgi:hypothetical protein
MIATKKTTHPMTSSATNLRSDIALRPLTFDPYTMLFTAAYATAAHVVSLRTQAMLLDDHLLAMDNLQRTTVVRTQISERSEVEEAATRLAAPVVL